jgi:hypothetical protein
MPDFSGVLPRPPSNYAPPQLDFSILGDLPQTRFEAQQRNRLQYLQGLFQGPEGEEALRRAGIDPRSLAGTYVRATGAPGAEPFATRSYQQQIFDQSLGGGGPDGPQSMLDKDPGTAAVQTAMFGQESGYGRNNRTSGAGAIGPAQMLPQTFAANALPGERIDDFNDNLRVGMRTIAKYYKQYGNDWQRAAVAYYSGEGNVSPPGSPVPYKRNIIPPRPGEPSTAQYVAQFGAKVRLAQMAQKAQKVDQPAAPSDLAAPPGSQLSSENRRALDESYAARPAGSMGNGPGAAAPTPAPATPGPQSSLAAPQAGEATGTSSPAPNEEYPVTMGNPPFARRSYAQNMPAAANPAVSGPANIQLASLGNNVSGLLPQPGAAGRLAPSIAPTSTPELTQQPKGPNVSALTPPGRDVLSQGPGQAGQPGAPMRLAQASQAGQPGMLQEPGLPSEQYSPQVSERYRAAAREIRANVAKLNYASGRSGLPFNTKAYEDQAATYDKRADHIDEVLAERNKQLEAEFIKHRGEITTARIGASTAKEKSIQDLSNQYTEHDRDILNFSRAILSDPAMYSGYGADKVLDWNKIGQVWGRDPKYAAFQEMLEKTTAAGVLEQMNTQREEQLGEGGGGARLLKNQTDQITKASPRLETTRMGNLALIEIQRRKGELNVEINRQKNDWLKTHDYLTPEFYEKADDWLQHNKKYGEDGGMFSKYELSHPELIGAPYVPPALIDNQGRIHTAGVRKWAGDLGLKPGDTVRLPDGKMMNVP